MFIRKGLNLTLALKRQYWPIKELRRWQDKNFRKLLNYAYKNVSFYRKLYKEHGVDIHKIKGVKDANKLPTVDKVMLQNLCNDFRTKKKGKYPQNTYLKNGVIRRTSGSTGRPLFVHYDKKAWDFSEAIYTRSLLSTGYRSFETMAVSNPFLTPCKRWFNYFGLFNKRHISMERPINVQLELLKRSGANTFYSYPTLLKLLAQESLPSELSFKRIISTGELLTEQNRRFIEDSFNTSVFNHYGTMECNRVAWECRKKEGMHMDIDAHLLEFSKDNEEAAVDETAEMILTNLHNFAFPLIRYRQGDFGVKSSHKCSCKRTLPIMKKLHGRANDFIKSRTLGYLSPIKFDLVFGKFNGILQYRLVQEKIDRFTVYLIVNDSFHNWSKKEIKENIKKLLKDPDVTIEYRFPKKLERSSGGKLRAIVSRVT